MVKTIGTAIAGLEDLGKLAPKLKELGLRHLQYGVAPGHYSVVGKALINAVEFFLKDQFTTQVHKTWDKVIGIVAQNMISTNYEEEDGPNLTPRKIKMIRESWAKVATLGDKAGIMLY